MSLKLLGIYTNPMPQHQGGQVTTQGPTPVQTNPGLSASANTIRACTAARREMPGMAESVSSKYATGLKLYREALLIRCCKLRALFDEA
ncbi:hypothetical protein L2E82_53747 [Cichorium intybus]|nr:hypothetical protein L2E82_53747 [Cichorium intybus]